MTETMTATLVAGSLGIVGTLVGIALNAFIEHKKRRERYLKTVFDKKIEAYMLISQWCALFRSKPENGMWDDVFADNKVLSERIKEYDIFLSNDVYKLIAQLTGSAISGEFVNKPNDSLLPLIFKIRAQCQKELGITDLQAMFAEKKTRSKKP